MYQINGTQIKLICRLGHGRIIQSLISHRLVGIFKKDEDAYQTMYNGTDDVLSDEEYTRAVCHICVPHPKFFQFFRRCCNFNKVRIGSIFDRFMKRESDGYNLSVPRNVELEVIRASVTERIHIMIRDAFHHAVRISCPRLPRDCQIETIQMLSSKPLPLSFIWNDANSSYLHDNRTVTLYEDDVVGIAEEIDSDYCDDDQLLEKSWRNSHIPTSNSTWWNNPQVWSKASRQWLYEICSV